MFAFKRNFATDVVNILKSDHNIYDMIEMYKRMENIIDMLAYGLPQERVKEILELRLDDFAVDFIRWKGL